MQPCACSSTLRQRRLGVQCVPACHPKKQYILCTVQYVLPLHDGTKRVIYPYIPSEYTREGLTKHLVLVLCSTHT